MDDARHDPRTAARVREIRAGCSLPVTQVHGSLEGRAGAEVAAVAFEPGGRHAALLLDGAVERWDLDALACVGRWEVPLTDFVRQFACVGEAPAGLRLVTNTGLAGGPSRAGEGWRPMVAFPSDPASRLHTADLTFSTEDGATRAIRLADGETLWRLPPRTPHDGMFVARGGRFVLHQVASTSFDLLEVAEATPSALVFWQANALAASRTEPPVVARLATDAALASEHVALHADARLLALPTASGVVLGRWDDWWSARPLPMPVGMLSLMEFTGDGGTLVLCDEEHIRWVDVATREVRAVRTAGLPQGRRMYARLDASSARVLCVVGAGLFVAEPGSDVIRTRAFDPVGRFVAVAGTADGRALITGATDGAIRVRDRATGAVLARAEVEGALSDVAASVDGREVFAATMRGDLLRLDLASGAEIAREGDIFQRPYGAPTGIAVAADGRHVALQRNTGSAPTPVAVVDTATGARHLHRFEAGETVFPAGLRAGMAFGPTSRLRLVSEDAPDVYTYVSECAEHPLAGGDGEVLVRWPVEEVGRGGQAVSQTMISRDGRLLWRVWMTPPFEGDVAVTAIGPPTRLAYVQWHLDDEPFALSAGRALLAVAAGPDALWLLSRNGRSVRVAWSGECAPLAFAPDDRALWVGDGSGLVVEVVVPEELLEDLDRVAAPDPLRA